ncbi:NACHT domain-containing protein [Streptomyces sp. NBC_00986]|uniref:NACHT domain-containing protein n=1 Tax=Streptomyces sp. NBC_00986 TaxID=2903702 RepID=UPI0038662E0E|nr:NACHT domain-containing protein [Streptomyces sp. NBC_00986]
MADRGRASVIAWTGATTCALVAGALVFVLGSAHAPLGVSDRSGLVSMVAALPALVIAVLAAVWARPGGNEDEAAAVARLAREVRAVGEPQWAHSLGGDLTAIDVTFTFRPYAHERAAAPPSTPAGQLERAVEDYRALRPRRLVITGEAGAGKTVLAWKLVMELNKARTEREPVPVLMALADWDEEEAVSDWIARHLERDYALPPRSARRIVEARMALPVLDGLDEMDAADTTVGDSRASLALDALAHYQDGTDPAPLILTCRTRQYDALEADANHLLDAARIEIDPVTPDRALRFLELRGAARRPALWQPLLDELRFAPRGVVSRALSTPWRLTLAATVYERDGDPGELLAAHTMGEAADLLLRRYVPAAVSGAGGASERRAGAAEVHRRLAVLARSLDSSGGAQTDLRLRQVSRQLGGYWPRAVLWALILGCVTVSIWLQADPWPDGAELPLFVFTVVVGVVAMVSVLSVRVRQQLRLHMSWYIPGLRSSLWRVGPRLAVKGGTRRLQLVMFGGMVLAGVALTVPRPAGGLGMWRFALAYLPLLLVVAAVMATQWINVAAVGPSGWARGGVLGAVALGCAILVMVTTWGPVNRDLVGMVAAILAVALAGGCEWMEYAVFLLFAPRLPFRLARFLDWSVAAGLMRTSGVTYQFRHREFQEWLVRHPVAVPLP